MFSSKHYHAKVAEYRELGKRKDWIREASKFNDLEQKFTALADNEERLKQNYDETVRAADKDAKIGAALRAEEEHILRCLSRGHHAVEQRPQNASEGALRQRRLHGRVAEDKRT